MLLSLLGVPWETVKDDYLLSNEIRKHEIEQRIDALSQLAIENENITDKEENLNNIKAFYILDGEYIGGTINAITKEYGSVEKYLNELGISDDEIEQIRNLMLK